MLSLDPIIFIYVAIAAYVISRAAGMDNRSPWLWGVIAGAAVYFVPYPASGFWRTLLIVIVLFGVMTILKGLSVKK